MSPSLQEESVMDSGQEVETEDEVTDLMLQELPEAPIEEALEEEGVP